MKKILGLVLTITYLSSFSFLWRGNINSDLEYRLSNYKNMDSVTSAYVLNHNLLTVMYIGKNPAHDGDEYQVRSCQFLIIPKVGEAVAFTQKGDKLPQSINQYLIPGTKIVFQNVSFIKHDNKCNIRKSYNT